MVSCQCLLAAMYTPELSDTWCSNAHQRVLCQDCLLHKKRWHRWLMLPSRSRPQLQMPPLISISLFYGGMVESVDTRDFFLSILKEHLLWKLVDECWLNRRIIGERRAKFWYTFGKNYIMRILILLIYRTDKEK